MMTMKSMMVMCEPVNLKKGDRGAAVDGGKEQWMKEEKENFLLEKENKQEGMLMKRKAEFVAGGEDQKLGFVNGGDM